MKGHKGIHHHGHVSHKHHGHVMHHHGKKKGGAVEEGDDLAAKESTPSDVYAGKDSPTVHEAEKRRKGGRAHKKHGGKVDGYKGGGRLDRHPRAKGGRTGAEFRPLSAAHSVSDRPGAATEKGEYE